MRYYIGFELCGTDWNTAGMLPQLSPTTENPTGIARMLQILLAQGEGISNISQTNSGWTKILRNGQIFILRDGKTYNWQGQEVK